MQDNTTVLVQKYEYLVKYQDANHYFIRSQGFHSLTDAWIAAQSHKSEGGHAYISKRHYGVNGLTYRAYKGA